MCYTVRMLAVRASSNVVLTVQMCGTCLVKQFELLSIWVYILTVLGFRMVPYYNETWADVYSGGIKESGGQADRLVRFASTDRSA